MTSSQKGLFIKTPSPHIIECLRDGGLDFAIVDAEHAPFDRGSMDLMILAGRAVNLPVYVRIPDRSGPSILSPLDLGASGLVVPHVESVAIATDVVRAAKYVGGNRGYSGSPRAAGYGAIPMEEAIAAGDRTQIIAQLEHPDALEAANEILALEGIAGVLVGRADLALAMGFTQPCREVEERVRAMLASLPKLGKIVGMVVNGIDEYLKYRDLGVNWFVMGTDHSMLRRAVRGMVEDMEKVGV